MHHTYHCMPCKVRDVCGRTSYTRIVPSHHNGMFSPAFVQRVLVISTRIRVAIHTMTQRLA